MKFLSAVLVSFLFTTSMMAEVINTMIDGDSETVTSIEATSQKKSGQVVYNCGNTPCEGVKKAYYTNGQLQISATFNNGVVVDTMKEYDENGQMLRLFCPDTEKGFEKQFYPNGQVKRIFENKTNECIYYYTNGNVWLKYTNNAGQRSNVTQYYENGQVRLEQKGNIQNAYYENGKLAYKCKRSEINKTSRMLGGPDVRFYGFEFTSYNEAGSLVSDVSFKATEMDFKNGFPVEITDVPEQDFDKVIYYDETGKPAKKEEYEAISNTRFKKVTYVYELGKWQVFNEVTTDLENTDAK